MPTFRFRFITEFPEGGVEADTLEEARALAEQAKEDYAGSNDGSEWLANAQLHEVESD